MIVFVAVAVGVMHQLSVVRSSAETRARVRQQFRGVTALMIPRITLERRLAIAVSLTAGVCEEVLYRGFFLWYLMSWLPGWIAVAISAVVFGIAHLYLGWGGVLKATIAGIIFGAAYLLTGSLWVPIALHAVVDISSFLTGSIAFGCAGDEPAVCRPAL